MSLFSSNTVTSVETAVKTDTQAILKKLDALAGAVTAGSISTEFLNILSILQPFITVVETDYPEFAATITWAESILKSALVTNVAPISVVTPKNVTPSNNP